MASDPSPYPKEKYIAANLVHKGWQYANAVAIPSDPNAKLEPVVHDEQHRWGNSHQGDRVEERRGVKSSK